MVFSCSWPIYYDVCVGHQGSQTCGVVPWEGGNETNVRDICHLWRYGADLHPTWRHPEPNVAAGGGGVGDVIRFASSNWTAMYRGITGRGAVNDPDFLAVGCPTTGPCGYELKVPALSDSEQRTQVCFCPQALEFFSIIV